MKIKDYHLCVFIVIISHCTSAQETNVTSDNTSNITSTPLVTETTPNNVTESSTTTDTPEPPLPANVVSVFFVNDLLYDIFPVHPDDGRVCDDGNVSGCVGGVGRLHSFIKNKMKNNPNILWLNAGNSLGGDWFKILKYKTALEAIKFLNFTFMAVGPDEFEFGQEATDEYLKQLNSTVVASNIDVAGVMKSGEYSTATCNISVIGFVDDSSYENSKYGVAINNVTESVVQQLNKTQHEHNGTSHLITLVMGSTTQEKARGLANAVEGIDVILYSGSCSPSETEDNTTEYLCWNKTDNSTYMFSLGMNHSDIAARFLVGELQITLGDNCSVDNITYQYHNYSDQTDDPWTSTLLQVAGLADLNENLTVNLKNVSGESETCSHAECSLGSLVADAMLEGMGQNLWTENATRLAVFPGVMFQPRKTVPTGNITGRLLYTLVQQDAYLYTVALTALQLTKMLNISLNGERETNTTDFLHVSNLLRVTYNRSAESICNVISVNTMPDTADSMRLQAVDTDNNETLYNVLVPFTIFNMESYRELLKSVDQSRIMYHNMSVMEAVVEMVNRTRYLALPVVGDRQQELVAAKRDPPPSCPSSTGTTILVTLVVTALILGACYGIWWYIFRRRRGRSGSTMAMMNLDYATS